MSLHINKNYAKKRGISKKLLLSIRAVMLAEQVDLVAGDFNGTAWRRQTNTGNLSIIEEAFADTDLPMPPGPTPLWGPRGQCQVLGQTFAVFSSPESTSAWSLFRSPRSFGRSSQRSKLPP